tara:strand:+ start:367 stop:1677 length:1311 start_codon:yes stop_codon:yes gene_type:complete
VRVGIIGGGVGGLGAAYDLLKSGHEVELYERAPFLGGLASTFDVGGGQLERFYHHLFTSDTTIIELLQELGLDDRLIWEDSKVGWFADGKIYPFSTPFDLLKFSRVSIFDRIRMGLVTLYLQRYKNWKNLENITAAEWMRKWAGKRNWEMIWEPLMMGKFTVYREQIAMPWLWSKFVTRSSSRQHLLGKEKLGYIRGSWGTLVDELQQRITNMNGILKPNTLVTQIVSQENRITGLKIRNADGEEKLRPFDVVISTVPTFLLPNLIDLPKEYADQCTSVEYEGAIAVIWVLKKPLSNIYWLNVADRDIPFLLALEQTNLVPPSEYGGKHIVYTANYVPKDDYRWPLDESDIVADYIPHLKKINPSFEESWIEKTYLHKEAAAQPIMTTNYSQKMPSVKTPINGLWTAAMSQVYPMDRGTNYSIQLGIDVARRAVKE